MGLHVLEAPVVSPGPLPARPPEPGKAPAPAPAASALERIVALALAAVFVVLVLVLVDLSREATSAPALPFDFENPLLFAQAGQCVEIVDESTPEAQRLVVRAPGPILRPYHGPEKIAGWVSAVWPDVRSLPPYLVCDLVRPGSASQPGSPPPKPEPYVFPLTNFGMPLEAPCVLRSIRPAMVRWQGQTRRGYEVDLVRYGMLEGPWIVWMSKDVPVLGTMKREYPSRSGPANNAQVFLVPPDCR